MVGGVVDRTSDSQLPLLYSCLPLWIVLGCFLDSSVERIEVFYCVSVTFGSSSIVSLCVVFDCFPSLPTLPA